MSRDFISNIVRSISNDSGARSLYLDALELRSVAAGIECGDSRILGLLEKHQRRLPAFRLTFQKQFGIHLEELLVSTFKSFGTERSRLLGFLYQPELADLTHSLYLGLSGEFTPESLLWFLCDKLAGGQNEAGDCYKTPEMLVEVAGLFERWYGLASHPENPSLSYAVWYKLEHHTLLHAAMFAIERCYNQCALPKSLNALEQG